MIMSVIERLEALPKDASVIWCKKCGHIHASWKTAGSNHSARIHSGADKCGRTLASGCPEECIADLKAA